jgi:hypothetical protein
VLASHARYRQQLDGSAGNASFDGASQSSFVDVLPTGPTFYYDRGYAPCVLMHQLAYPDRVLFFGGREGTDEIDGQSTPNWKYPNYRARFHNSVQEFAVNQTTGTTTGAWYDKTSLLQRRELSNAVILPTQEVFIVGGQWQDSGQWATPSSAQPMYDYPVVLPEIYTPGPTPSSPGSTRWASIPNPGLNGTDGSQVMHVRSSVFPYTPRTYHSFALLLPDARVFVGGGQDFNPVPGTLNPSPQFIDPAMQDLNGSGVPNTSQWLAFASRTGEVFSPPYLFQGWRPVLDGVADVVPFGTQFSASVACGNSSATIDSFVLIRVAAVTHHFSPDQRSIELAWTLAESETPPGGGETSAGAATYVLTAPSQALAPTGFYLLFAVMQSGGVRVPSEGRFIRLT